MTVEVSAKEFADLKRRVELAETRIAQQAGTFEFITGQLRDVQLYLHAKFADLESQLGQQRAQTDEFKTQMDRQFAELKAQFEALPRIIAEMIAKR